MSVTGCNNGVVWAHVLKWLGWGGVLVSCAFVLFLPSPAHGDPADSAGSGRDSGAFTRIESGSFPDWWEALRNEIVREASDRIAFREVRTSRFSGREREFTGVLDRSSPDSLVLRYRTPEPVVITLHEGRVTMERAGRERSVPREPAGLPALRALATMDPGALGDRAEIFLRGDRSEWEIKVIPEHGAEVESFHFSGKQTKVESLVLEMGEGNRRRFEFSSIDFDAGPPVTP